MTESRSAAGAAAEILRESLADPWGAISPAVYDTAHTVRLAAPLRPPGCTKRLLVDQHPDGSWGPEDAHESYRIVPTLAATASILATAGNSADERVHGPSLRQAALQGLAYLVSSDALYEPERLPDTVAVETIVPAQLTDIAELLDATMPDAGERLRAGVARARQRHEPWHRSLTRLRFAAASSHALPPHILHTVEVLGPELAARVAGTDLNGGVACSPAATAAVLGGAAEPPIAMQEYLATLAQRHNGAQPNLSPISTFEQVWIAAQLVRLGVPLPAGLRTTLVDTLESVLRRDHGAGMAPGFLIDSDITSSVLGILHALDRPADPVLLHAFAGNDAFFTYYPGERTLSPTVNAHVLEALSVCGGPDAAGHTNKAADFLLATQEEAGTWTDKWHASPYYTVSCCASALARHDSPAARRAADRARRWILETQRADGSWGWWAPTPEETAYSVQTLLSGTDVPSRDAAAASSGVRYLLDHLEEPAGNLALPPLWHGKELFTPARIVTATILGVVHMALTRLPGLALSRRWMGP